MATTYTYSDLSLTFKKHPSTDDVILKYDLDSVKQALMTLFLTNNFEKRFDPNFGISIPGLIFENLTPLTSITLLKKIRNQLAYYDQRVYIDNLIIRDNPDYNEIAIDFYFHVIGSDVTQQLTLKFERVR